MLSSLRQLLIFLLVLLLLLLLQLQLRVFANEVELVNDMTRANNKCRYLLLKDKFTTCHSHDWIYEEKGEQVKSFIRSLAVFLDNLGM